MEFEMYEFENPEEVQNPKDKIDLTTDRFDPKGDAYDWGTKTEACREKEEALYKVLEDKDLHPSDISAYEKDGVTKVAITIDGDWKHDNGYLSYVMSDELGWMELKNEEIGDSQDDWYESVHTFITFPDLERFNEMRNSKTRPIGSALDTVKLTFDNGDTQLSDFNADVGREEMARYYMNNWFNLGSTGDDMHKVVKVEFPDDKGVFQSLQIKSALWDYNKEAVDEIMKYCDDLHLPCGVAGNTFTVAKDFVQGPYKNIEFESVEQVKQEIDNFVKSSRKPVKSARFIIEDENGEVIAEADTYEEAQTVNGAKIIDTENQQEEGGLFSSVDQDGNWDNDYGFTVTTVSEDGKPVAMEDGFGHTFNLLDIGQPYPTYEDWENDVKDCFNPELIDLPEEDENFLEENPDYLNELYDFQDKIHRQYYGTDLIANSYNQPKNVSSHRQSKDSYTLRKIISGVISGNITEEKAIQQICVINNCNTGYAKTLLNNYIKSGIMDIADDINQDFNVDGDLDSWFNDYVPKDGKASTVGGELLRAIHQIISRYQNDGDYIGYGYGRETCNPAARYIVTVANDFSMADQIQELVDGNIDAAPDYNTFINELEEAFEDYLRDHEEFFHAPNKDAYEDYKEDDDVDSSIDECYVEVNGMEYWFERQDDGWRCTGYGMDGEEAKPEYDVDDVFDDNDDMSNEISEKTDDYYDFVRDGWSYSVEAYDDPDENDEHHEWLVTSADPVDAEFHKDDFVSTDDLLKHDVYDMNGRTVQERDLY